MALQRYFLEVCYKGTHYSGFQKQENANSIQAEVEKAFQVLQREAVQLTGSSRTDTGVHALQNYFHFDFNGHIHPQFVYKMNAILPRDIVLKNCIRVAADAHCRFDAVSREYKYCIYRGKDPFLEDRAFYFPYTLDIEQLQAAALAIKAYTDFRSFSKRNTQVKTFICSILKSEWAKEGELLVYRVKANRFLRGMVRGLVATMLQVGRGKISIEDLGRIIEAKDCTKADFSAAAHGLYLVEVAYPATLLAHEQTV